MFRKKYKFEDEKRDMPVFLTVVIAILFLVCAFGVTYWVTGAEERQEMASQYDNMGH